MNTPEQLAKFDPAYDFIDGRPFSRLPYFQGPLTNEERAALHQEGFGITAAEMADFETPEEFRQGENNFHLTFTASPNSRLLVETYRGKLAFQRFAALYPEQLQALDAKYRGRDSYEFADEEWSELHEVYKVIAKLVDRNDYYVMQDGEVDGMYLCA